MQTLSPRLFLEARCKTKSLDRNRQDIPWFGNDTHCDYFCPHSTSQADAPPPWSSLRYSNAPCSREQMGGRAENWDGLKGTGGLRRQKTPGGMAPVTGGGGWASSVPQKTMLPTDPLLG